MKCDTVEKLSKIESLVLNVRSEHSRKTLKTICIPAVIIEHTDTLSDIIYLSDIIKIGFSKKDILSMHVGDEGSITLWERKDEMRKD